MECVFFVIHSAWKNIQNYYYFFIFTECVCVCVSVRAGILSSLCNLQAHRFVLTPLWWQQKNAVYGQQSAYVLVRAHARARVCVSECVRTRLLLVNH